MSDLKPCPCGKVPTTLGIECDDRAKWGRALCDCGDWSVEFKNAYAFSGSDGMKARARAAWNDANRLEAKQQAEIEQLREMNDYYNTRHGEICDQRDALRAEIERMKTLLAEVYGESRYAIHDTYNTIMAVLGRPLSDQCPPAQDWALEANRE